MAFIWDKNTGKIGPALVKVSSSPSYTLAEIGGLMKEYIEDAVSSDDMRARIELSLFLMWLAKREQGKESRNGA